MGVAEYLEVMNFLQRNEPIDNEVHVIIDEPVVIVDNDDFHVINEVLVLEEHHYSPNNDNDGLVIVEGDHDHGADEYDHVVFVSDEDRPLVIDDRGEPSDSAESSVSSGSREELDQHDDRCHSSVSETIELCIKKIGGAGPSARGAEEEEDDALPGVSRDLSEEEPDWWEDSDESDIEFYLRNYFSDCNDDESTENTAVKMTALDSVDPDNGEGGEDDDEEEEERLSVVSWKRSRMCERAQGERKHRKNKRFWGGPDVDTTEDAGRGQKTGEDASQWLEDEAKHLKPSGKRSGKRKHIEANKVTLCKK